MNMNLLPNSSRDWPRTYPEYGTASYDELKESPRRTSAAVSIGGAYSPTIPDVLTEKWNGNDVTAKQVMTPVSLPEISEFLREECSQGTQFTTPTFDKYLESLKTVMHHNLANNEKTTNAEQDVSNNYNRCRTTTSNCHGNAPEKRTFSGANDPTLTNDVASKRCKLNEEVAKNNTHSLHKWTEGRQGIGQSIGCRDVNLHEFMPSARIYNNEMLASENRLNQPKDTFSSSRYSANITSSGTFTNLMQNEIPSSMIYYESQISMTAEDEIKWNHVPISAPLAGEATNKEAHFMPDRYFNTSGTSAPNIDNSCVKEEIYYHLPLNNDFAYAGCITSPNRENFAQHNEEPSAYSSANSNPNSQLMVNGTTKFVDDNNTTNMRLAGQASLQNYPGGAWQDALQDAPQIDCDILQLQTSNALLDDIDLSDVDSSCMEQIEREYHQEALREVDLACSLLKLPQNAEQWTEHHVDKWIMWTVHQCNLPVFDISALRMSGTELCKLSAQEMLARVPTCGDILHARLRIWKSASKMNTCRHTINDLTQKVSHELQANRIIATTNVASTPPAIPSTSALAKKEDCDASLSDGATDPSSSIRSSPTSSIHLWVFLKELLLQPQVYGRFIRWMDKEKGVFKIEDSVEVARLWGIRKNRPAMNYDKLSRSIRQYYKKGIIKKTPISQRLVYQFVKPVLTMAVQP